jgi:signal transduction histidine kinase/ActR/RegA family two-component response regulator
MVLMARIEAILASGAVVELSDGRPAWLPAREIYPEIKPHEDFRSRAMSLVGTEVRVVEFPGVGMGRPLVSHVRATDDPWKSVAGWQDGQVKVMEVVADTRGGAIGIIPWGVRASVQMPGGQSMLPLSWRDFDFPLPGDEVAGYFRRENVNERDRIVTLDFEGYVRSRVSLKDALVSSSASGPPAPIETALRPIAEVIDGTQRNALRSIGPTLIVDNDEAFLRSLNRLMTDFGCHVHPCNSYESARELLWKTEGGFELAILDVHLSDADDSLGLALAEELAQVQPNCRIVLISADDLDRNIDAVSKYSRLPVAGFMSKPLGIDDLVGTLANTGYVMTLGEFLSSSPRGPARPELAGGSSASQDDLKDACETLRTTIGAKSVVLFSIDPVSYQVKIEARADPEGVVYRVQPHLDRSPVRDAAIDWEDIFTGHASGPEDGKKHLYLRRAYDYESCIGVPVRLRLAHPLAHALFAFHSDRDGFIPNDKNAVKLVADSMGWILRARTLAAELRQMKPFELMGKVYGSMAHDLRSALPDGPMLANLLKEIDTGNVSGATQTARVVRDRNERARGIVETFRKMARGQHDEVTDFPIVEAVEEAVGTFAKSTHLESQCRTAPYSGPPCRVHMRRSGLHQIIYNLLLNAAQQIARLRALRPVEEEILVEVQHVADQSSGDWAVVLVHDNGPGIHKRDFERVFDIHYTTKEDGCGMGLDICRSITESVRHGERTGSVRVRRSILLAGTTFDVRFPL